MKNKCRVRINPAPLTLKEIDLAYARWANEYASLFEVHKQESQLRGVRRALGLTSRALAGKLKTSAGNIRNFEKSEIAGGINLATLRKIAEAMDCELTYSIKHKSGEEFVDVIFEKMLNLCVDDPFFRERCWAPMRGQALYAMIKRKFHDSKTRVEMGWSNRVKL